MLAFALSLISLSTATISLLCSLDDFLLVSTSALEESIWDNSLLFPEPLRCLTAATPFSVPPDFSIDTEGLVLSPLLSELLLLVLKDLLELFSTFELLCSTPFCVLDGFCCSLTWVSVTWFRSLGTSFSLELVVKELLPESTDCSLLDDDLDNPALELLELPEFDATELSLKFYFTSLRDFVPGKVPELSFPEESEALTSRLEIFDLSAEELSRGVLNVDPSLIASFEAFAGESA
nr:unnamed protein product [Callosobruchus analis]